MSPVKRKVLDFLIAVTGRHVSNKSKNCFRLFSIVVKTVGEPD